MSNHNVRKPPIWLARAQTMRAAGESLSKIAAALNVSKTCVAKWMRRSATETPPEPSAPLISMEQAEAARQLRAEGKSWEIIGRTLAVNRYRIRKAIDAEFAARVEAYNKLWNRERRRKSAARDEWERKLVEAEPKPKAPAGMLAAGRFLQPEKIRYGR